MKYFGIILVFISFFAAATGEEAEVISAEKLQEIQKGMQQMRDLLQQAPNLPAEEAIPRLGRAVYKTSHNQIYKVPERVELHERLEQALIVIPGHAEYYQNKINESQEKLSKAISLSQRTGIDHVKNLRSLLSREQMYAFQELQEIRSSETIKALGEMLFDERGVITLNEDRSNLEAFLMQRPVCQQARRSLEHMIEEPPTDSTTYPVNLEPWKNWYTQIKEGRRTYRFKGDHQEYNLLGPAREALNPDIPRAKKRPSHQEDATKAGDDLRSSSSNAPTITAIFLAVLIGGGYWVYRRKSVA